MADERVTRRLVYGGQRLTGTKSAHGWYEVDDFDGNGYLWDKLKGVSIGGIYTVESPAEDPVGSVFTGTLQYTREKIDDLDTIARWQAVDADVKATLGRQAAERKHGKSTELDEALEPLLRMAREARTRHEARALATLASERITEAYWRGKG